MLVSPLLPCSSQDLAAADTIMGSYEIPVLQKAFLGLAESSAEGTTSRCSVYIFGGVVTLMLLFASIFGVMWLLYRGMSHQMIVFRPAKEERGPSAEKERSPSAAIELPKFPSPSESVRNPHLPTSVLQTTHRQPSQHVAYSSLTWLRQTTTPPVTRGQALRGYEERGFVHYAGRQVDNFESADRFSQQGYRIHGGLFGQQAPGYYDQGQAAAEQIAGYYNHQAPGYYDQGQAAAEQIAGYYNHRPGFLNQGYGDAQEMLNHSATRCEAMRSSFMFCMDLVFKPITLPLSLLSRAKGLCLEK